MSRRERRVADEPAIAVEHRDLDLDGLARNDSGSGFPSGVAAWYSLAPSTRSWNNQNTWF